MLAETFPLKQDNTNPTESACGQELSPLSCAGASPGSHLWLFFCFKTLV